MRWNGYLTGRRNTFGVFCFVDIFGASNLGSGLVGARESVCPLRALEEGIKDFDAALFEVTDVAGDDSEFVSECGSSDHAIFDWHGLAVAPQLGKQLGPRRGGCRVEVKDVYFFHADTESFQEPIAPDANL